MQLPFVLGVGAVEDLINRALDLDPAARLRLAALSGQSVMVRVDFPRIDLLVFLDERRLQLTPIDETESVRANAVVRATSINYLRQLLKLNEPFQIGELQVEGDTALLQTLHDIARGLDIDWESPLSRVVGDIAARQIGQGLRGFFGFARQAAADFLGNTGVYLREHGQWFPYRWQVDDFIEEVQELRGDIERTEARIARLERTLASRRDAAPGDAP